MSERFQLNREDLRKWLKNAALFLAPAAILALSAYQTTNDINQAILVLKLWVLDIAIDLLRKFVAGSK